MEHTEVAKISEKRAATTAEEAYQNAEDVGYTSRIFVQALFPYRSSTAKERVITQNNRRITLSSPRGLP